MSNTEHKLHIVENLEESAQRNGQRKKLIALVDLAGIFRSAWHGSTGRPLSHAYDKSVDAVWKILRSKDYNYARVIACIDKGPYKRVDFYPAYKANREDTPPELDEQYRLVQEKLRTMGVAIAGAQGFEADDCIATICKHAMADNCNVHIWGMDKDLMQLVGPHIKMIDTYYKRYGDLIDAEEVEKRHGVPPKQIGDYLTLLGDDSDNIPGADGIGKVTAAKLLKQYGSLEAIMSESLPGKIGDTLRTQEEQIMTSSALVALVDDVALEWGALMEEPQVEDADFEPVTEPDNEPPEQETSARGDALIGGALARQEGPGISRAEGPPPSPVAPVAPVAPVVRNHGPVSMQLGGGKELSEGEFELLWRYAKAQTGRWNRKYNDAQAVFGVILAGRELGIGPNTALANFHDVEGKPTMGAHLLIARAQSHRDCIYFECVEQSATSVTYVAKKRTMPDREMSFTYTLEEAKKDNMRWATKPANQADMLRKTAGSKAARMWFPGAVVDCGHSVEEMGYAPDETAA